MSTPSAFEGAGPVRAGHELPLESLMHWLGKQAVGELKSVRQFNGGQSNPTYLLETDTGPCVLRRKPAGVVLKGAHAVEREFRVISALHQAGFPVPAPIILCEDETVIGSPFYLMERVQGRIFWSPTLPGLTPVARAAHFDALNTVIAQLHSLNVARLGLETYGRPGDYFTRQISRWSQQYLADDLAGHDPNMDRLIDWLPKNSPPDDGAVAVVHGDFRADNAVFAMGEARIKAVLDWELSTLGHPMGDFTYHLMMYRLPPTMIGGFAGADLDALGIPSEADYLETYCQRTGRAVPTSQELSFYMAFNMFRLAAIFHGIKGRIARGTAASAHAQTMADNLPALAALAWAQTGEIA